MAIAFPDIHPVAFSLGPVKVHWYALSYVAGILLSCMYAKALQKRYSSGLFVGAIEGFAYGPAILGIIIGGRLGHVIFYDLAYHLQHPLEILMTWKGGMSFHGGLIGFLISAFFYCRYHTLSFFKLMDTAAVSVPIAIGLGRIANFINGELFGYPTSLPIGVIFPYGGGVPRHPTQIYEALCEGLVLWIVLSVIWIKKKDVSGVFVREKAGVISGLFLFLYGAMRFAIEFLKDPEAQSSTLMFGLNHGHLLSLPMIVIGLWMYRVFQRRHVLV